MDSLKSSLRIVKREAIVPVTLNILKNKPVSAALSDLQDLAAPETCLATRHLADMSVSAGH
jgi:hypothetical protein